MSFKSRTTTLAVAGAKCSYCGDPATVIDHIQPRADFVGLTTDEIVEQLGQPDPDHVSNLTPACAPCNASKSNTALTDWLILALVYDHLVSVGSPTLHKVCGAIKFDRAAPWVIEEAIRASNYMSSALRWKRHLTIVEDP